MRKYLCIVVVLCALLASASGAPAWYYDDDPVNHDGDSAETAYLIDSVEALKLFRDRVNDGTEERGKYYRLTKDLDISSDINWTPIGFAQNNATGEMNTATGGFRGNFDGDGHTIIVNINRESSNSYSYAGLFGALYSGAGEHPSIKNLTVSGDVRAKAVASSNVAAYYGAVSAGGIVIIATGSNLGASLIENCTFRGTVSAIHYGNGEALAGGIVARNVGTVSGCQVSPGSQVSASQAVSNHYEYACAGGIAGSARYPVSGSTSHAKISSTEYAGGIIGYLDPDISSSVKSAIRDNRYSGALWGIGSNESDEGCTYTPLSVKILTQTLTPSYAALGRRYEAKLEASEVKGVAWEVISGDLPEGITLGTSGILSGVAISEDIYSFEVQVSVPGFENIRDTASYTLAVTTTPPASNSGGGSGGGCSAGISAAGLVICASLFVKRKFRTGVIVLLILYVSVLTFCADTFAEDLSDYLDDLAKKFADEENIPNYILKSGNIDIIRSYGSTLKAIREDGAVMYSLPDTTSQRIMTLANRTEVTADATYESGSLGDWYFVHAGDNAKGWVLSKFIIARDEIDSVPQTQPRFRTAHVTGRKVNVRKAPNTRGKVLYQVSRVVDEASEEYLIVDAIPTTDRDYEDWYRVVYRYKSYGGDSEWSKSYGWIIGRYLQLGDLSEWDLAAIRNIH